MFYGILHKGVWIAVFATICLVGRAWAQDPAASHQVQAVVEGLRSPQHAYEADKLLRALPGVIISRTDHNTRNLFMRVSPQCAVSAASLNGTLAELGMSVRCFQRGPVGPEPFRHLDPRSCGLAPNNR